MSLTLLTAAMTFSEIVGLLNAFVQSRKGDQAAQSAEDFYAWLQEHGHRDVISRLEANQATSVSIKALLAEGIQRLESQLKELDKQVSTLAHGRGQLGRLAAVIRPDASISDLGLRFLIEMERTGSTEALAHSNLDRRERNPTFSFLNSNGGFDPGDDRFFADDLDAMLSLGILKLEAGRVRGMTTYRLTRGGSEWIRAVMASRPDLLT